MGMRISYQLPVVSYQLQKVLDSFEVSFRKLKGFRRKPHSHCEAD